MRWCYIFIVILAAFQNVNQNFAIFSNEDFQTSWKVSNNISNIKTEKTPYKIVLFDDSDLNRKYLQRMQNLANDHKSKTNKINKPKTSKNKKRKTKQIRKKPKENTKEIEYFENTINNDSKEQQKSNKNKYNMNTFGDREPIMIKTNAGKMTMLPMRVDNGNNLPKAFEILNAINRVEIDEQTTKIDSKQSNATERSSTSGIDVTQRHTKLYQSNIFVNPFGQLVAIFGNDQLHLQDYTFFFNAERHTTFQLHTTITTSSSPTDIRRNNHSNNNNKYNIFNHNASKNAIPFSYTENGSILNAIFGGAFMTNANMGIATTTTTTTTTTMNAFKTSPANRLEEIQLYNATSLRQSRFNPFNPTRILIHGWLGGASAGVYQTLIPAYLRQGNGNYNVITVDWGRGAIADYLTASYRVKSVGKVVAKFIDFLQRETGMLYEDLHVIGFSMGAHIAGIAGKHIQSGRLQVIYALDPALPFFRYENFDDRIAITDANYIEVVHTSVGSYGYDRPLGHVDFYVNYGSVQPGCFFNECSHMRAYQIFAESLITKNAFQGQGCDVKLWADMIKYRRCAMGTGRQILLGGDPLNVTALRERGGGVFYLTTNAVPPYAKTKLT